MKTIVFGIDGGTFELIKPMIDEGYLPNLNRLMKEGIQGELESTEPPHTAPGWASAVTGVGPGTHGIYQFWDTQAPEYIGKFVGANDFGVAKLWDILNQQGITTGIINVPMSHPPAEVDGYMLSWPLSKTIRYSYPPDLLNEIIYNGGHYLPDIYSMFNGDLEYIDEALEIIEKRTTTVKYLMEKYPVDFLMVVFPEVDRICHYYWHFFDPESPEFVHLVEDERYRNAIYNVYKATDKALGEILNSVEKECNILVLSDHGFGCGYIDFYVQNFLKDKGYINVKPGKNLSKRDANPKSINMADQWTDFVDGKMRYEIDWETTKAYMASPGSYGININLQGRQTYGIVSEKEYDTVCNELIEILKQVEYPETGEKVFKKVVKSGEIYHGKSTNYAPDIMLIPINYGVMVQHRLTGKGWFSYPEQKGMHRRDGIFIASGSEINHGVIQHARLEDVLPTLLYLLKLPLPKYMEGDILPIFTENFLKNNPKKFDNVEKVSKEQKRGGAYSEEEQDEIKKRLKALGYL